MNFEKMIVMTALEYRLYKFYERIKDLTQYDNNDHPDVIWGDIKNEVEKLDKELEGGENGNSRQY